MALGALTQAWVAAEGALPTGWALAGLELEDAIASTFTTVPDLDRARVWRAWAIGPNGERKEGVGPTPHQALTALTDALRR